MVVVFHKPVGAAQSAKQLDDARQNLQKVFPVLIREKDLLAGIVS
jgi:hypothetical protein